MNRSHLTEGQLQSDVMTYCEKEIQAYNQLKSQISQISSTYSGLGGLAGEVSSDFNAGYSEGRKYKKFNFKRSQCLDSKCSSSSWRYKRDAKQSR